MRGGKAVLITAEEAPLAFAQAWSARIGLREETAAIHCVEDESMRPATRAGDLLLVDGTDKEPTGAAVFVACYPGEFKARRTYLRYDGVWTLRADNREGGYLDQTVPPDDQGTRVVLVGRVLCRAGML